MGTGPGAGAAPWPGAGSTSGAVVACLRAADEADALAGRVRALPPPTWRGPAADELADGVRRAVRSLDDGGAALHDAAAAARRVAPA